MVELNDQIKSKKEQLAVKQKQLQFVEQSVSQKEDEIGKAAEQKQKLKNFHKEESLQKEKQDLDDFRKIKENAALTDAVYNVIVSLTQTEEQRKKNKEGAKNPAIYAGAALITAVFTFILLGPLGVSANTLALFLPIIFGLLGFAGNKVIEDKKYAAKEKEQKEKLSQEEVDAINKTRKLEKDIDKEKGNQLKQKDQLNKEIDDLKNQISSDERMLRDVDLVNAEAKSKLNNTPEPETVKEEKKNAAESTKSDEVVSDKSVEDKKPANKNETKDKISSSVLEEFTKLVENNIDNRHREGKSKGAYKRDEVKIELNDKSVIYDTSKMANDIAKLIELSTGKGLEGLSIGMIKTVVESRVSFPTEVEKGRIVEYDEKDPYKNYRHYFKAIAEKIDTSIPHDGAKINNDIESEIKEIKKTYETLKTGILKEHGLIDSKGNPVDSKAAHKISEINEKVERKRDSLGDAIYGKSKEAKKERERI